MDKVIYRVVGENTHVLNVSTGNLMTFKVPENEILPMFQNWADPKLELSEDVLALFAIHEQTNTRLCRDSLNSIGMEFEFPTIVNLELNRRCSMRCVHCYIGTECLTSSAPSVFECMSEKNQSLLLDKLREMGVFLLVFTGGEPFLNIKFKHLLELAMKKRFVVEIFSNLQYIPLWFWEMDSSTLVGRVQTSVYSSDPVAHDTVTTIKGSHERTMANLVKLRERGLYVEVATPLMKHNFDSWEETKHLFKNLGIKQDFSWPIVGEYYTQKTGKTSLNITPQQLGEFVEKDPDFLIRTDFNNPTSPICEAGKSMFCISAKGDVFPCSQLPFSIGNITEVDVRSIYESKMMQKFRDFRSIDTGLKMAYNYCLGENYVETGDPLMQSTFFKISVEAALTKKGEKT